MYSGVAINSVYFIVFTLHKYVRLQSYLTSNQPEDNRLISYKDNIVIISELSKSVSNKYFEILYF